MNYREMFEELLKNEGKELKVQLLNLNGAQACIRRMIVKYNNEVKELSEDMQVKLVTTTINKAAGEYSFKLINEQPRVYGEKKRDLIKLVADTATTEDDDFDWSLT